jgi:hypothetical protein
MVGVCILFSKALAQGMEVTDSFWYAFSILVWEHVPELVEDGEGGKKSSNSSKKDGIIVG